MYLACSTKYKLVSEEKNVLVKIIMPLIVATLFIVAIKLLFTV